MRKKGAVNWSDVVWSIYGVPCKFPDYGIDEWNHCMWWSDALENLGRSLAWAGALCASFVLGRDLGSHVNRAEQTWIPGCGEVAP